MVSIDRDRRRDSRWSVVPGRWDFVNSSGVISLQAVDLSAHGVGLLCLRPFFSCSPGDRVSVRHDTGEWFGRVRYVSSLGRGRHRVGVLFDRALPGDSWRRLTEGCSVSAREGRLTVRGKLSGAGLLRAFQLWRSTGCRVLDLASCSALGSGGIGLALVALGDGGQLVCGEGVRGELRAAGVCGGCVAISGCERR